MSLWSNVSWPDWLDMDDLAPRPAGAGRMVAPGPRPLPIGGSDAPVEVVAAAPVDVVADAPIDVVAVPGVRRPSVAPRVIEPEPEPEPSVAVRPRRAPLESVTPTGSPSAPGGAGAWSAPAADRPARGTGRSAKASPHPPLELVLVPTEPGPGDTDAHSGSVTGPAPVTGAARSGRSGRRAAREAAPTGETDDPSRPPTTAPTVLSPRQRVIGIVTAVVVLAGLVLATVPTLIALMAVLVVFFSAANLMKLWLIGRALDDPQRVRVDAVGDRIPDEFLPIYTILLPVFHEAGMLPQLVDGILSLDYPEDRLDVKLLLEEEDTETREAASAMDLPACFDVLVVPDEGPTGKPRACNHGLAHAKGAYLVIFDAEDRPEADQLRKSVAAFWSAPRDVVCFQAQLNYFNRTYNLLTRWFTAEYSVWFDQLLPGLQAMDVVIPLGGTSNHFITSRLRLIGGWNSYNVTEDADLGLRIFLQGWKTAVLESTTYEEATSRYRNWIRQRSRWVKGYMQTYLFHMRQPVRMARRMGSRSFTAFQLFFGAGTLCLLLNPLFWLLAVVWFATKLHLIQTIFPWPVLYLGTIGLFVGNAACVLSVVVGCLGRRNYDDVKYALFVPVYWILMSVGAWKALVQLFTKPHYWEKTEHGFCLFEEEEDGDGDGGGDGDGDGGGGGGGDGDGTTVPGTRQPSLVDLQSAS